MFANWYAELNWFSLATFPPVSAQRNTFYNMYIYMYILVVILRNTAQHSLCCAVWRQNHNHSRAIYRLWIMSHIWMATLERDKHIHRLYSWHETFQDLHVCVAQFQFAHFVYMSLFDEKRPPKSFYVSFNVSFIDSIHDTRHFKKICMPVLHNSKAKSQSFSRNSYSVNIHCLCVTECYRVLQSVAEGCRGLLCVAVSTATVRQEKWLSHKKMAFS